jgi:hypothetical protein
MPSTLSELLREPTTEELRQLVDLVVARVALDVGEQILDEDLAPELLAEEAHIGARHRAQIEQHGLVPGAQRGQESRQHVGGLGRRRTRSSGCRRPSAGGRRDWRVPR